MSEQNINIFMEYIESIALDCIDIDKIIKAIKQYEINLDDLTEKQILIILSNLNDYNFINKLDIKIIEWEFANLKLSDIIKSEILHNCILTNNLEIVEYLSITDLHCKYLLNKIHYNIFAQVCFNDYLDMARFLIDYQNINIDKDIDIEKDKTKTKKIDINNMSLIHQPYDYNDILIESSIKGYLDIFIYIIEISNKFNKDYYRILLKDTIIRESLINNNPHITKWVIENWGIETNSLEYGFMSNLISIFEDCIIKNSIDSLKYIYDLIIAGEYIALEYKSSILDKLTVNVKRIFNIFNIKLKLTTMQYLFITFINNEYLEDNNYEFIKTIFENIFENILKKINNSPCDEETKLKLNWLASLSDGYTIVFNEYNIPILTILNKVMVAIKNNNILEACNLLSLESIDNQNLLLLGCNICLDKKNHSIITTCNHHFCLLCIYTWLYINKNNHCPYCRSTITLDTCKYYIDN